VARRRSIGVPGSAVLAGTAGLYLIYVGFKNVPFVDGLRSLLRKQSPQPKSTSGALRGGFIDPGSSQQGELGLVGNALAAYKQWRRLFPSMTMYGRGARPNVPSSDHPKGLAIDLMTSDETTARNIINFFKLQTGAKYWIWNRQKGSMTSLWVPYPYTGENSHTDHVHLSYY